MFCIYNNKTRTYKKRYFMIFAKATELADFYIGEYLKINLL